MHRLRHLSPAILAILLVTTVCSAQPAAPGQTVCGGRLRVDVPPNWQFTPAGEAGAVLRSADPRVPPIEIVGWDVPRGGEPSPASAASAQETLLFRTGPYARASAAEYKTLAGASGLLVVGQVKAVDGELQEAAFAAFAEHGRFYIVGTFAPAGAGTEAVSGPFGQVLQSLIFLSAVPVPAAPRPAVEPPPTPPIAQPLAEPPDTRDGLTAKLPPDSPVPAKPAPVEPPPPTPAVPQPEPRVRYESPLGFRLEHPAGWTVTVADGRIEIASPANDEPMAVIWPLTAVVAGQDSAALARRFLSDWKPVSAEASTLTARTDGDTTILAGMVKVNDAQRRLVACCQTQGDSGLLTVLLLRPEDAKRDLPVLTSILGSFSAGPWWTREPKQELQQTLWREPSGGPLQLPVPTGWKVRGGTQNYNGTWSLFVELTSTDPRRLSISWQQPIVPLYRDLTPVLGNLGWQEGDKYVANPGDQSLRILSRLSPQDFLTRQLLTTGPGRLQAPVIDKLETLSSPPALLVGANAAGLTALISGSSEQGPRLRFCLLATADAPARIGANAWQAALLQVDAPSSALDDAVAVLRAAIGGATASGGQPGTTGILQLIRAAQEALPALPAPPPPSVPAREVLPNLGPRGKGNLWLLPPQALAPWQQTARELQGDQDNEEVTIPELRTSSWK